MCGELEKSMYGTRDAAQNWEHEYSEFLESMGFKRGIATPCAFWHPGRKIRIVVHGDDFTALGHGQDLDWFRQKLQGRYENKAERIGPDSKDNKVARILNRVVEWTEDGINYEPDQRHAEIIVQQLGLAAEKAKAVTTPGVRMKKEDLENNQELEGGEGTMFRAIVARANYLAQDRTDIQFAVKELARRMSKPDEEDWKALKRLGRYLVGNGRYVVGFRYQGWPEDLTVWTDADYAGCLRTRSGRRRAI